MKLKPADIRARLLALPMLTIRDQENGIMLSYEDASKKYVLLEEEFANTKLCFFGPGYAIAGDISPNDLVIKLTFDDNIWEISWLGESVTSMYWHKLQELSENKMLNEKMDKDVVRIFNKIVKGTYKPKDKK